MNYQSKNFIKVSNIVHIHFASLLEGLLLRFATLTKVTPEFSNFLLFKIKYEVKLTIYGDEELNSDLKMTSRTSSVTLLFSS